MRNAVPAMFALAISAGAQPAIRQNGVVNSASRIPPSLAGGAIARGALFTIHGVHFGLHGPARVIVSSGGKSVEARILSATAEKIDAEMPKSAALGKATVTVKADGAATTPFPIDVVDENPGLFSRNGLGWGPGRIENLATERAQNSAANPAHPLQRVALFGTGFGKRTNVVVTVGGKMVKAARAGSIGGEDRIEFSLPAGVLEGCYVPVYVPGARTSNVVTMSIRSGAGPCRPGPVPPLDRGKVGVAVVSRTRIRPEHESADFVDDQAVAAFASLGDRPALSPMLMLPPAGTCTAYTGNLQEDAPMPDSITAALASMIEGRGLDAGPQLTVGSAVQSRRLIRVNSVTGYYRGRLGEGGPNANRRAPALFLEPGNLDLTGSGGKNIGAFDAKFAGPLPFEWTNRGSIGAIDRNRPLTLDWRNAARGSLIVIAAMNVDQITTATGTSMCVADGAAGEFTIPAEILANLPASKDMPGIRYDRLALVSIAAQPAQMRAAGIDDGAVIALYTIVSYVRYR